MRYSENFQGLFSCQTQEIDSCLAMAIVVKVIPMVRELKPGLEKFIKA